MAAGLVAPERTGALLMLKPSTVAVPLMRLVSVGSTIG